MRIFSTVYSTVEQNFAAKLCNSTERAATPFVRLLYDSQRCATQRKRAQLTRLELQISCSTSRATGALSEINSTCRIAWRS